MTAVFEEFTTSSNPDLELERRRALRALLRNPMLLAAGDTEEAYILIRRHSLWLKQWLRKFPAWSLHIDKQAARLRKVPPDLLDETRHAIDRVSGMPFSRRRYALVCLTLAALERSDRQITLGQIAGTIMEFVAADQARGGHIFDIGNYDQRRDLIHAVRLLADSGVLHRLTGDEQQFLNRSGSSGVVYEIDRPVLGAILNVSASASAVERTAGGDSLTKRVNALVEGPPPEDAAAGHIRARLTRILLDDPILYFDDLNDEERRFLEQHRSYLLAQIAEATGLLPEIRREGIAMVDDEGDLTDVQLPEENTEGHATVLVAGWLAEQARHRNGRAVPIATIEQHVVSLIRIHGSRWRKEVRERGAEAQLTELTLLRLRALRLIRISSGVVEPLAACGRYAVREPIQSSGRED